MERALADAPELPDTQLALGIVSLQEGRFSAAISALERAVAMAPTHTLALEQLGRLEIEAGRAARGMDRLAYVAELDPMRRQCLVPIARAHALRGKMGAFDDAIARLHGGDREHLREEVHIQMRVACWTRDTERARAALCHISVLPPTHAPRFRALGELLLGTATGTAFQDATDELLAQPICPRLRAVVRQLGAEAFAERDLRYAMKMLEGLASEPLIDIEWIELCPALEPMRGLAAFDRLRDVVRERVAGMWAASEQ